MGNSGFPAAMVCIEAYVSPSDIFVWEMQMQAHAPCIAISFEIYHIFIFYILNC